MDFTERLTKAVLCLTLGVATLAAGCQQEKAVPREVSTRITWREGDLVFRQGTGTAGHAVALADTGGTYSHVGVVVLRKGEPWVVHAVPGEPDYEGDPDRVKMETPEKFFSSINARIGEIKRLRGDTAIPAEAARIALGVYRRGTLFDHDYDDNDTTKMYCCELIESSYRKAGLTLARGARHYFKLPGLDPIRCILPSDICNNDTLDTIIKF